MHHYNSVLSLQITICNGTDGDYNDGATMQSCSGAWVWLIIILVVISCTDLSLYVQLRTFLNFGKIFMSSTLDFLFKSLLIQAVQENDIDVLGFLDINTSPNAAGDNGQTVLFMWKFL